MTPPTGLAAFAAAALSLSSGVDARAKARGHHSHHYARDYTNATADTDSLKTWWHSEGVYNSHSAVSDQQVRQSNVYSVQVSTASSSDYYNSFVYEAIPRSGKGKLCRPDDLTTFCDEYDGISIEDEIGVTMAWSQFLYGTDVQVKIARVDGNAISKDDVVIRPTTLGFDITEEDDAAVITVPYRPDTNGVRFSVELNDDLWTYQTETGDGLGEYVQNVLTSALDFVSNLAGLPIVGKEPKNALLIFASPFPSNDLVPVTSEHLYDVTPGYVEGLENIQNTIVRFGPGVYHFTGMGFANLSSTVEWVYLAPGAYVKGAVQWNNGAAAHLKATGFGVLSGEQYVYQANTASGFANNKSDDHSVKMFRGYNVTSGQTWTLHGLTMAAPPFNAMDFYGAVSNFTVDVADYKQVGSFYAQTDGLQMYPNSHIRDVFYHTGDDTLKLYYSNILAERIVAWKTNNAPTIQIGWHPRNVSNVTVDGLDVIHSRYASNLEYAPRALIGSSSSYSDLEAKNTANTTARLKDFMISNVRAEGISSALLGLNLLANVDNFHVKNAWIETLAPAVTDLNTANVTGFADQTGRKVACGDESTDNIGIIIEAYKVGDENISFARNNWAVGQLGGLRFDDSFKGRYTVIDSTDGASDDGDSSKRDGGAGCAIVPAWKIAAGVVVGCLVGNA